MTYEEIKEIVTQNPDITAEEFGEKLKQSGTTDTKICDLFMDIIRSTLNDRNTFLKAVELLAKSNINIDIGDTVSKTVLDYAVICGQPEVIKIFLDSGKFDQKRKLNAFSLAINGKKVQEFEVFLDYIDHAAILDALNIAPCNERTNIMKVLSDNKIFTEQEKVDALSNACIDSDLPKVRLLLKYMKGVPEDGIRNLLEIIEDKKLSLREELKIDSEFKVDFSNSNHDKYLSSCVIIALLRSAINKKQNTPNVKENRAGLSGSNRNSDSVRNLYTHIARTISSISFESLQEDLSKQKISLQSKCEQGAVLGNALLEHAIKDEKLNVIKFLLQNEVTIINAISQEGRHYISKIEEDKSILCSVVHYTDNSNAEILNTLLQNINTEQLKLNPESELYRLYQQLKDDAFCTAIAENNSVAATVLTQNDQETRASAVNKDETPVVTTPTIVTGKTNTTVPSIEKNRAKPCSSNGNIGNKPTATVPPILTKKTNLTTVPNSGNGRSISNKPVSPVVLINAGTPAISSGNDKSSNLTNAQFSRPNEKETKYKENFYTSLTKDAVGVVITGLFIAAAVMVPFAAGAAICGIVAALVAVCTGLHIKNSTLPSYREMEKNKVEHVSSKTAQTL